MGEPEEVEYDLVMPFMVCRSRGGPYEDESFVAGWELATIDVRLTQCAVDRLPLNVPIHTPSLPQAELIAMSHGYLMAAEPYEDAPEEWSMVTFTVPALEEV
jgi:hypothetical protein